MIPAGEMSTADPLGLSTAQSSRSFLSRVSRLSFLSVLVPSEYSEDWLNEFACSMIVTVVKRHCQCGVSNRDHSWHQ
jgi:hypothetical protein